MNLNQDKPNTRSTPAFVLAARYLFPFEQQRFADDAGWRTAGRWFIVWGLLIGVLYAAVFRLTWRWFGEYQYIRFVPVAFVLAVDLAWGGYRLLAAMTTVVGGGKSHAGLPGALNVQETSDVPQSAPLNLPSVLAIVLIAIGKYALLLSLPMGVAHPERASDWSAWPVRRGLLYPQAIYRPLILMPIWGRWAMMLAMVIGRVSPSSSNRLRQMAGGTRLVPIMAYWLACTVLTVVYGSGSSHDLDRGLMIALGVMVVSYLASFTLARRTGGQTEATVGAAGLVAELAFLAMYLPVASHIYWY